MLYVMWSTPCHPTPPLHPTVTDRVSTPHAPALLENHFIHKGFSKPSCRVAAMASLSGPPPEIEYQETPLRGCKGPCAE